MKLSNFFSSPPDQCERLISGLEYCLDIEEIDIDEPDILYSVLEKGLFYRGMFQNFDDMTLNNQIKTLLENFTEFETNLDIPNFEIQIFRPLFELKYACVKLITNLSKIFPLNISYSILIKCNFHIYILRIVKQTPHTILKLSSNLEYITIDQINSLEEVFERYFQNIKENELKLHLTFVFAKQSLPNGLSSLSNSLQNAQKFIQYEKINSIESFRQYLTQLQQIKNQSIHQESSLNSIHNNFTNYNNVNNHNNQDEEDHCNYDDHLLLSNNLINNNNNNNNNNEKDTFDKIEKIHNINYNQKYEEEHEEEEEEDITNNDDNHNIDDINNSKSNDIEENENYNDKRRSQDNDIYPSNNLLNSKNQQKDNLLEYLLQSNDSEDLSKFGFRAYQAIRENILAQKSWENSIEVKEIDELDSNSYSPKNTSKDIISNGLNDYVTDEYVLEINDDGISEFRPSNHLSNEKDDYLIHSNDKPALSQILSSSITPLHSLKSPIQLQLQPQPQSQSQLQSQSQFQPLLTRSSSSSSSILNQDLIQTKTSSISQKELLHFKQSKDNNDNNNDEEEDELLNFKQKIEINHHNLFHSTSPSEISDYQDNMMLLLNLSKKEDDIQDKFREKIIKLLSVEKSLIEAQLFEQQKKRSTKRIALGKEIFLRIQATAIAKRSKPIINNQQVTQIKIPSLPNWKNSVLSINDNTTNNTNINTNTIIDISTEPERLNINRESNENNSQKLPSYQNLKKNSSYDNFNDNKIIEVQDKEIKEKYMIEQLKLQEVAQQKEKEEKKEKEKKEKEEQEKVRQQTLQKLQQEREQQREIHLKEEREKQYQKEQQQERERQQQQQQQQQEQITISQREQIIRERGRQYAANLWNEQQSNQKKGSFQPNQKEIQENHENVTVISEISNQSSFVNPKSVAVSRTKGGEKLEIPIRDEGYLKNAIDDEKRRQKFENLKKKRSLDINQKQKNNVTEELNAGNSNLYSNTSNIQSQKSIHNNNNNNNNNNISNGYLRHHLDEISTDEQIIKLESEVAMLDSVSTKGTKSTNRSRSTSADPTHRRPVIKNAETSSNTEKNSQRSNSASRATRTSHGIRSNSQQVRNALTTVCLAGPHQTPLREEALLAIDTFLEDNSKVTQFLIVMHQSKMLSFKGLYIVDLDNGEIKRISGRGPKILPQSVIEEFYKYESSTKTFRKLPTLTLNNTCDAVTIDPTKLKKLTKI